MEQNSRLKRMVWSQPVLRCLSVILIPFRILYRSHVYYLLYVVALTGLMYYLARAMLGTYHEWLSQFIKEYGVNLVIWDIMAWTGNTLVGLILLPLLLSLLAGPARHVFLYNHILPGILMNEIPVGVRNTFQTCCVAFVRLIFALLPVFVLSIGYFEWAAPHSDKSVQQAYILAAAIACLSIIYHQIPVLFAPVLSAISGFDGHSTVRLAPTVLSRGRLRLTFLVGLCVAMITATFVYSAPYIPKTWHQLSAISIVTFWSWYFLNHIFFILLRKTIAFEQRHTEAAAYPSPLQPAQIENIVIS